MSQLTNTPLNADDELRSKLRELEAFRTGFGFDANELIEFILADREKQIEEAMAKFHLKKGVKYDVKASDSVIVITHTNKLKAKE